MTTQTKGRPRSIPERAAQMLADVVESRRHEKLLRRLVEVDRRHRRRRCLQRWIRKKSFRLKNETKIYRVNVFFNQFTYFELC